MVWYTGLPTFAGPPHAAIGPLLQPLEDIIQSKLIPAWTGRAAPNCPERKLYAVPAHLGGLSISVLPDRASDEISASVQISALLKDLIESQQSNYTWEAMASQVEVKREISRGRQEELKLAADTLRYALSEPLQLAMDLAQEKSTSTWLTSLPLEEFGFSLHKVHLEMHLP